MTEQGGAAVAGAAPSEPDTPEGPEAPDAWADWRTYGDSGLPRILQAALEAFAEHGYHGTSIRDIAARSGLSVPGLYHHHRSKQEILAALMAATMEELLGRSRAALADAGEDPAAGFDLVVESMVRFHMARRASAFVASSEMRSLGAADRAAHVAARDAQQGMLRDLLQRGAAAGTFAARRPNEVARAVSTLCVGVASWYREDGAESAEALVARQVALARALAAAPDAE